jgi:hypothetical protein
MAIFDLANFIGTAGTQATAYTPEAGGPIVSNLAGSSAVLTAANRMRGNASGGSQFIFSGIPASPNYILEASVYCASNVNGFGICLRATSGNTGYAINYVQSTGLVTLSGGGLSPTSFSLSPTPGNRNKITFKANSGNFRVLLDNVQQINQNDTGIMIAGLAGFMFAAQDTDSTGFQLESFTAYDLALSTVNLDGSFFVSGGTQLFFDSDNELYLLGLVDLISGTPQTTATVSAQIETLSGTPVGSPVSLSYVTGSLTINLPNAQTYTSATGNYEGQLLAATANLLAEGATYYVVVTAIVVTNQRIWRGQYTAGYSTK